MCPVEYPRILFITPCSFNHLTGGGITFSSLFRGWPPDRLATITDDPVKVSFDVCRKYFFLTPRERTYIKPFHLLKRASRGDSSLPAVKSAQTMPLFFRMVKSIIGNAGVPDRGLLSPELFRWIKEYNPDAVYSILGTKGYIELVDQVQAAFQMPLAIHLMDDGVTDPRKKGFFGGYLRKAYASNMQRILKKTSLGIAICEMMADEYKERYGMEFVHFQNTIDVRRWETYAKKDFEIRKPVRIAYIGSILPHAQMQSLVDACRVVKKMNNRGSTIVFDIYTPKEILAVPPAAFEIDSGINIHDAPVNDEDFFRIMADSDLLVLPVNFDPASIEFIRLSMPTKIPAYLASGTPILVYGPKNTAQVEYAREARWGYVVDNGSLDGLEQGLSELIADGELRANLSSMARLAALKNHDDRIVRKGFQKALIDLGMHG